MTRSKKLPAGAKSSRPQKKAGSKSAPRKSSSKDGSPAASKRSAKKAGKESGRSAPEDELYRVLNDDGSVSKANDPGIPDELLLRIYRTMREVRQFDERMLLMQRQGRVGFYGPIKGQEAATIGSCAALEERDWIFPALREAGCALYRGLPLREMIAQCIGNSGDVTQGRQMPCHYSFKKGRYVAMSSVIGTQIPHAVGAAMGARIRGEDTVIAGYLGDGATSSPEFHAAMNFAAVYKAPCLLICQNNQWAISVPFAKQTATRTVAEKARAYGMDGVRVDGNDALAVFAATRKAAERARGGGGPTLLELVTYRILGHTSSDDPTRYRDESEVQEWRDRDPIQRLRVHLEKRGLWSEAQEQELDDLLAGEIAAAVREAEAAAPVEPATLVTDVYADVPNHLREQMDQALKNLRG